MVTYGPTVLRVWVVTSISLQSSSSYLQEPVCSDNMLPFPFQWWLLHKFHRHHGNCSLRGCPHKPIRQISVYHRLPWFFRWKITILPHKKISHLFGPTQFFLYITRRFSRSPKTAQFAVGSGAILRKLKGSVKPDLQSRISWLFYTQMF